jgi:hypothetical protein
MMRDHIKEAVVTLIASVAAIWISTTVFPSFRIFLFGAMGLVGTPLFLSLICSLEAFKYEDSSKFVWSAACFAASAAALIGVLIWTPDFGSHVRSPLGSIFRASMGIEEFSGSFRTRSDEGLRA